jgi:hypothetical protein
MTGINATNIMHNLQVLHCCGVQIEENNQFPTGISVFNSLGWVQCRPGAPLAGAGGWRQILLPRFNRDPIHAIGAPWIEQFNCHSLNS